MNLVRNTADDRPELSLPELAPGEILESIGEYRLPGEFRTLKISEDQQGNLHVAVLAPTDHSICIPFTKIPYKTVSGSYAEYQWYVESERGWLVTVDERGRIWFYYGPWKKEWGPLRSLPHGGTRPYASAVLLYGQILHEGGTLTNSGRLVVEPLELAGAPEEFVRRVQAAARIEN